MPASVTTPAAGTGSASAGWPGQSTRASRLAAARAPRRTSGDVSAGSGRGRHGRPSVATRSNGCQPDRRVRSGAVRGGSADRLVTDEVARRVLDAVAMLGDNRTDVLDGGTECAPTPPPPRRSSWSGCSRSRRCAQAVTHHARIPAREADDGAVPAMAGRADRPGPRGAAESRRSTATRRRPSRPSTPARTSSS